MPLDSARARQCLKQFEFKKLFIEELGWDRYNAHPLDIPLDGTTYKLQTVAEKRGMVIFSCEHATNNQFPDHKTRRKIERQAAKTAHEHVIIYTDSTKTTQIWQWVKREQGRPEACREQHFHKNQSGDPLIQKLQHIAFGIAEEESLTTPRVAGRVRQAFDLDRVTKRFYDRFQTEHEAFLDFIKGIQSQTDREWYASLMLNRLMFIYFIQKKRFLDGDPDYLRNRLRTLQERKGKDRFLTFYRHFLLRLFHEGFGQPGRSTELDALLGIVPYLNGGLFDVHELEKNYKEIQIADTAFERVFDFFDAYQWHLDERPLRDDNEINPDVLGYIFEKYINQKEMGAYYTQEDITEYIAKNTIVPFIFDAAQRNCPAAFEPNGPVWRLLREDPDRYIFDAVRKGVLDEHGGTIPLPPAVAEGLDDVSKRGGWNKPASDQYALPTETWREHVTRRNRCLELRQKLTAGEVHAVNDLITLNLNIRQFAQDVIENSEDPELLRAFYHAIERISVLDPTCGSGAFLFAALNVLEPLYDACLDRMQAFLEDLARSGEKHRPEKFSDFRKTLAHVDEHPNHRYFVLKSIVVNNLYGVDIMEEAVEICKLRLFLKLVAQVERVEDIEPLPDVDFNIRAGNTLVGYVSLDDVRRTLEGTFGFAEDREELSRVEERAEDANRAFTMFQKMQTEHGMDAKQFSEAKAQLRQRLQELDDELNGYLARDFGIDTTNKKALADWRMSHQPFHWFVDFFAIITGGGFSVIIGNPPYIELKEVTQYKLRGYSCESAGNLYALVMERCFALCSQAGRLGFIVPVSSVSTERYLSLQRLLSRRRLHYSSFDDRPSRLFDGLEHIRLTIHIFGEPLPEQNLSSTRYNKWSAVERPQLFNTLRYAGATPAFVEGSLPKLTSEVEHEIVRKLGTQHRSLSYFYSRGTDHRVLYSRKVGYFLQVLDFQPRVLDGRGRLRPPSEFKELSFTTEQHAKLALCCLNSNLFYWFVTVFSDCRHVNKREVDAFPIDLQSLAEGPHRAELTRLGRKLMKNLDANSDERTMSFKHDTLTVQCIIPKKSKPIIDEIDAVLARHYGFTDEELDFITNYDIKYRMGQDGGDDAE